jgi:hypothetical protein
VKPVVFLCAWSCAVTLPLAAQSLPSDISISQGSCATGVHLITKNATVPEILRRLADDLPFELKIEGDSDVRLSLDLTMQAPQLVRQLASSESIIIAQSRDSNCPGQSRIVKVWLIAKGDARVADSPRLPSTAIRQIDEQSRQAREAYQDYVRLHGKPPPGEEEEVTKHN